jgi:hypothetical protein
MADDRHCVRLPVARTTRWSLRRLLRPKCCGLFLGHPSLNRCDWNSSGSRPKGRLRRPRRRRPPPCDLPGGEILGGTSASIGTERTPFPGTCLDRTRGIWKISEIEAKKRIKNLIEIGFFRWVDGCAGDWFGALWLKARRRRSCEGRSTRLTFGRPTPSVVDAAEPPGSIGSFGSFRGRSQAATLGTGRALLTGHPGKSPRCW